MLLLKTAINTGSYDYIHLLSGDDLPLKTNDEIDSFFETNRGKQYIAVTGRVEREKGAFSTYNRYNLYHFFVDYWRRNKVMKIVEFASISIQDKLGIDRTKGKYKVYWGANWFSITQDCARYVLSQESFIRKVFMNKTRCADELFLQTVVMNSPLAESVVGHNKRYVKFKNGKACVLTLDDFDNMISSDALFARKFDISNEFEIIQKLENLKKWNPIRFC